MARSRWCPRPSEDGAARRPATRACVECLDRPCDAAASFCAVMPPGLSDRPSRPSPAVPRAPRVRDPRRALHGHPLLLQRFVLLLVPDARSLLGHLRDSFPCRSSPPNGYPSDVPGNLTAAPCGRTGGCRARMPSRSTGSTSSGADATRSTGSRSRSHAARSPGCSARAGAASRRSCARSSARSLSRPAP